MYTLLMELYTIMTLEDPDRRQKCSAEETLQFFKQFLDGLPKGFDRQAIVVTDPDTEESFFLADFNSSACTVEWRAQNKNGEYEHYIAGCDTENSYPCCLCSTENDVEVYSSELLNHEDAIKILEEYLSSYQRPAEYGWREIVYPFENIVCDDISLEPQFGEYPLYPRIVVNGINRPFYKPIYFDSVEKLFECLNSFGVEKLREFGNPVEYIDAADIKLLYAWNAVKVPVFKKKSEAVESLREALKENLDSFMAMHDFKRAKKSTKYKRKTNHVRQVISCNIQFDNSAKEGRLIPTFGIDMEELQKYACSLLDIDKGSIESNIALSSQFCTSLDSDAFEKKRFYDSKSWNLPLALFKDEVGDKILKIMDSTSSVDILLETYESNDRLLLEKYFGKPRILLLATITYLYKNDTKNADLCIDIIKKSVSEDPLLQNFFSVFSKIL